MNGDEELFEDELENVGAGFQDRETVLKDMVFKLQSELSKPRNTSEEREQIYAQLLKAKKELEEFKLTQDQVKRL